MNRSPSAVANKSVTNVEREEYERSVRGRSSWCQRQATNAARPPLRERLSDLAPHNANDTRKSPSVPFLRIMRTLRRPSDPGSAGFGRGSVPRPSPGMRRALPSSGGRIVDAGRGPTDAVDRDFPEQPWQRRCLAVHLPPDWREPAYGVGVHRRFRGADREGSNHTRTTLGSSPARGWPAVSGRHAFLPRHVGLSSDPGIIDK